VVILVKEQNIEYYRKQFPNPKIVVESVQYKECGKFLKKSTLGRQFSLLRKCFSAKQGHSINETDDSRIFIYKKELSRSSFFQRVLFSIVVRAAYVSRNHRWCRKLIVGVEGALFPGKNYGELIRQYRPDLVITLSLGYMIDLFLIRAARRHSVKIAAVIQSSDNTSTKDYRVADPDYKGRAGIVVGRYLAQLV